jgi:hypothetical protein
MCEFVISDVMSNFFGKTKGGTSLSEQNGGQTTGKQ